MRLLDFFLLHDIHFEIAGEMDDKQANILETLSCVKDFLDLQFLTRKERQTW